MSEKTQSLSDAFFAVYFYAFYIELEEVRAFLDSPRNGPFKNALKHPIAQNQSHEKGQQKKASEK